MLRALTASIAIAAASLLATHAGADTITLTDGRVLEGEVTRDLDGYVWFKYEIAGVPREEMFAPEDYSALDTGDAPDVADEAESDSGPARGNAAPANTAPKPRTAPGAPRGAVISLGEGGNKDMIGMYITSKQLEDLIPILEADNIDIVVFRINSGGGALLEIQPLSDTIHEQYKPRFRTVGWIESAISAAAMTAHCLEEIYFMPEGNYGACTGWRGDGDAIEGGMLEQVLYQMEAISQRGGHDYRLMRSMQIVDPLSVDFDDNTGDVTFRQDEDGEMLLNRAGQILTLNSQNAEQIGFSDGTVATLDELTVAMGYNEIEWVGQTETTIDYPVSRAEKETRDFRDRTLRDQTKFNEYATIFQTAMDNLGANPAFATRARRALGDMRRMVRNNPNFALFNFNMTEEQFNDWYREQEEMIREALR